MFDKIEKILIGWMQNLGMSSSISESIYYIIIVLSIIVITVLFVYFFRWIFKEIGYKLSTRTKNSFDDELYRGKFFLRVSLLIPLMFCDKTLHAFVAHYDWHIVFIFVIINALYVLWFSSVVISMLNAWNVVFDRKNVGTGRSIKNIVQALKIVLTIITIIIIISILFNKSTSIILKSVGALSAVLMLVFKDTIIGFVSGIQLAFNRIILIGDWIEMPQYDAEGTVKEISLITVKIENLDKTTTTIPTYSFVTNSVKNWHSLADSGTRRITRKIYIDMSTIKFCDDELINRLGQIDGIKEYIKGKSKEIETYNKENGVNTEVEINGRCQTNLGIFRAYLANYLMENPHIDTKSTLMVRQLQPTNYGIPLEIYAFTNTYEWLPYEDIQSDIFDHILASINYFDLKVFQSPSSESVIDGETKQIK